MGSSYSQALNEAKERDGTDFALDGVKIKAKEAPGLMKKLAAELPNLQLLEIKCKIKVVPSNITLLPALEILRLSNNKLTVLPTELGQCNRLEELDLAVNVFQKFPIEIAKLPALRVLNLGHNQLTSVPAMAGQSFPALFSLVLEGNEFTDFPRHVASFSALRVLNLNENKLTALVGSELGDLANLRELHLRGNQLTSLPPSIGRLLQLTLLDVSENSLTVLPKEIACLRSLVTIEAQHNRLTEISPQVCSLECLVNLKMNDNAITEIPAAIGNLVALSELHVKENQIKEIPQDISKCQNLSKIYLEFNQLSSLPEEIAHLKRLVTLILHNNNISVLPACISNMTNLLRLSLAPNPLDARTLEIIASQGALALVHREVAEATADDSGRFNSLKRKSMRQGMSTMNPKMLRSNSSHPSADGGLPRVPEDFDSKKKKSKDAEAVPSFSAFKSSFDSLLEEEDFSKKKREALKKLPDSEKWDLLSQYQRSTLALIKEQKAHKGSSTRQRRSTSQKSVVEVVQALKENKANRNIMTRMKASLKENKTGWLLKFVEAGGIVALTQCLNTSSQKPKVSARDHEFIKNYLEIFRILLNVSLKSVLTTSGSVAAIAQPLTLEHAENKYLSVSLLEDICSKEIHIGAQLVFEAINVISRNEEIPFFSLVQCLEDDAAPVETKATCLALINQLIDSIDSLEARFKIRTEFMRMGFQSILDQLKADKSCSMIIQMERELFEEETKNDYEDMRCRFQRSSIIKKISPSGDGTMALAVVTDHVHTHYDVGVTPDTTVGDLKQEVIKHFNLKEAENYGLFSPAGDGSEEVWLKDEDIFAECGLTPEQMSVVEFRMTPWTLTVTFPSTGRQITLALDPTLTCEQALAKVLAVGPPLPKADYCFMLNGDSLEEAKPLERTPLIEPANRASLTISERPLRMRVVLGLDTWQTLEFNPNMQVQVAFDQISKHVGRLFDPEKFALVLESPDLDAPVVLEEGKRMKEYSFSENCSLRFKSKGVTEDEAEEEEECNIWEEKSDGPDNITFEEGKEHAIQNIETATLNKLVERVTSPEEYDLDFVNVFIMMYRAFTTEERLWNKLTERFRVPATQSATAKNKIQARVCIFIKNWVQKVGADLHEKTRSNIKQFLKEEVTENNFKIMVAAITDRLDNPKPHEDPVLATKPPTPFLPKNIKDTQLSLEDVEEIEVARQLTLTTFSIYKKIRSTEFFKTAWSKEKYQHLAPNILAMIDHYNDVAVLVASIIVSADTIRARTKAIQRIIEIGAKLRELNNFHLVSAFVSALSNSAVDRLKFTKARISRRHRQMLEELESTVSMEGSFKNLREALSSSPPPCIPFMGAYLTDLVFIADGNKDKLGNRINFIKHKYVYNVITRIQTYQSVLYNLEEVDSIRAFIEELPRFGEKDMYARSLRLEPRGATRADIL